MNHSTAPPPADPKRSALRLRLLIALLVTLCVVGVVRTLRSRWYLERRLSQMSRTQLEAWTRDHPDDALGYHYLGAAHHRAGEMRPAGEAYVRALERDPTLSPTRTKLAGVLMNLGRSQAAETILTQGIQIDPTSAELHMGLGQIREGRQDFRGAVTAWEKATTLAPQDPIVWFHLGSCWIGLNDEARALAAYERAATLDPLSPEYQSAYAGALRLRGRYADAEKHGRRAVQLNPTDAVACFELMKILRDRDGATAEAQQWMEKAVALDPEVAQYHYYLATLYQERENPDRALAEFAVAQALYEKSPPRGLSSHWTEWGLWLSYREGIHFNRARLLKRQGHAAEAAAEIAQYTRLNTYHVRANHLYGLAANRPGDSALRLELARVHEKAGFLALAREQRQFAQQLRKKPDGAP